MKNKFYQFHIYNRGLHYHTSLHAFAERDLAEYYGQQMLESLDEQLEDPEIRIHEVIIIFDGTINPGWGVLSK